MSEIILGSSSCPGFGNTFSSTPNTEGMSQTPALPMKAGAVKALHRGTARSLLVGTGSDLDPRKQLIDMLGFALKVQVCLSVVYFQTRSLFQKAAKEAGWCWVLGSALPRKPRQCSINSAHPAQGHSPLCPGAQPSSCNPPGRGGITAQHQHLTSYKGLGALLETHLRQSRSLHWNRCSQTIVSKAGEIWLKYFLPYGTSIQHSSPSAMVISFQPFTGKSNKNTFYWTYLHLFPSSVTEKK